MRVSIIKDKKIKNIILPNKVFGNFWITDKDINGLEKNLISIEAKDNQWLLVSNNEAFYMNDNMQQPYAVLEPDNFYTIIKNQDKSQIVLYCSNIAGNYQYLDINDYLDSGITIGKDNCIINYQILSSQTAIIQREKEKIYFSNLNPENLIFKDNIYVDSKKELKIGETIFIYGLKCFMIIINNRYYLAINNPKQQVSFQLLAVGALDGNMNIQYEEEKDELDISLYHEEDYFHRTPRFQYVIEPLEIKIDPPPTKEEKEDSSLLLTIGPMLTMSMTSMVTGYTAINNVLAGKATWSSAMPSLIITAAMLASVFIWPLFSKAFEAKRQNKREKDRQKKYKIYIESKKELIKKGIAEQSSILKNKYPDTKECEKIILNKYTTLWQKKVEDDDFLEVNLGYGNCPMKINISFPEEHFSMAEDNLKEMLSNLGNEPKILVGVPIVYNIYQEYISGIIGQSTTTSKFIKDLIIQLVSSHSYDNLKIVMLTTDEHLNEYSFMKMLPHVFSNDRKIRFFGTNNEEYKEICYYLDRVFTKRMENIGENHQIKKEDIKEHYLIITDDFKKVRNYDIIGKILDTKNNMGFHLLIADTKVTNLPDGCKSFIELMNNRGEVHSNVISENVKFEFDPMLDIDYMACSRKLSNIPIEISTDNEGILPNKVGFLEMYDVGKIEQLNSLARWKNNNPVLHLESAVGLGKNGEIVSIDLHEKFHGPHGLIAGMTGSGKSEFIITYILSMAINYHPNEVQFVLIDYKGGGLAGAFENKTTNLKLPHLVGTITNLDKVETKRCLASIDSELKRRQSLFNQARELSDESTMDIYKYQQMYRDGLLKTPISHLFIISDEFAELKQQQPEFMEQLIQTARIGRSLGVHLILATQKPSGIVDAQIWSNTRFRVCLRVQDKGDSQEVIKCPDAAYLTQTGRFYFQVGFNEVFTLGQAAWAGAKYIPSEKVIKNIDTSINIINNIGYIIKTIDTKEKKENQDAKGEELNNIVKYLADLAKQENISCNPLWLDKIPAFIEVDKLKEKYNYEKVPYLLNPIVGEYDIPAMQTQKLLTLPLTTNGNALIYGASGSGKENFITTLIYSSMLYDNPNEVNYYIMDFGSESLKMFSECPLIGNVLTVDDSDKISNLFKMLTDMIEERKNLFSSYNGEYISYCKNSGNALPNVVVIINNYEAYQENYEKYDDVLVGLTRECSKYGIYFIITVNTPNGVRFKLKQNFPQIFCLQQNNEDDYTTILGNIHKMYPSKIFGRGIIKYDDVYEFQTALVCEKDNIPTYIREKSKILAENTNVYAKKIPELPEVVSYKDISQEFSKDQKFIIGIEKNDLTISKYDFIKNDATMISSMDLGICSKMINPLINQILAKGITELIVINAEEFEIDSTYTKYYKYYNNNFNDVFTSIYNMVVDANQKYEANNYEKGELEKRKKTTCIIIGINTFRNKLSEENKQKFGEIFTISKELDIIHYIIVDSIDQYKKIELESWYKTSISSDCGIWIGNGINDQFTLKVNQKIDEMKEDIPDGFCFVVNRGRASYVKYVGSFPLKTNG